MKFLKKILSLLLAVAVILSFAACGSDTQVKFKTDFSVNSGVQNMQDGTSQSEDTQDVGPVIVENPDVILLADENGYGDMSNNDFCRAGCKLAEEDFLIKVSYVETYIADNYASALTAACGEKPKLIICASEAFADCILDIAAANPNQKFLIVGVDKCGDNVAGITFNTEEGAFLAGIAAGMMTKSDIVSYIGDDMSIEQDRLQYGFEAGVATVDRNIYIDVQYVGSSATENDVRAIASAHAMLGSDVIFGECGRSSKGLIMAAENKDIWAIGNGADMSAFAPYNVLCSAVCKASAAVYSEIAKAVIDTFTGNDAVYTMMTDSVGISDGAGNLPDEVARVVGMYSDKIAAGELTVPYDWQTCYDYKCTLPLEKSRYADRMNSYEKPQKPADGEEDAPDEDSEAEE